jgi:DNA-binding NarL/FixJ family response regulator
MVAAIIDSHPVFLNGLTQFLYEFYPKISVIRSATLSAFNAGKGDLIPDFVILGVNNFFKPAELKTLEVMKRSMPSTSIVIYYDEIQMVIPFLKTGASGFLAKKGNPSELLDCLESILKGKRYLNNEVFEWIVRPVS